MQVVWSGLNAANHIRRAPPATQDIVTPRSLSTFLNHPRKSAAYRACNFLAFIFFSPQRFHFPRPSKIALFISPQPYRPLTAHLPPPRIVCHPTTLGAPRHLHPFSTCLGDHGPNTLSLSMRIDPPYPSFTSIMVKMEPSFRLPTYRSTHAARFHPYPRGGPRRLEAEDLFTVSFLPPLATFLEGDFASQDGQPHVGGPSSNSQPAQHIVRVFCRLWLFVCVQLLNFPPVTTIFSPPQRPARRCAAVPDNADVSSFELDIPVVGVEYDEDELLAAGIPTGLSRSKLAVLLSVSASIQQPSRLEIRAGS